MGSVIDSFQNELAQADEYTIGIVVPLEPNGRPADRGRIDCVNIREEQHFLFQIAFVLLINPRVPEKKHNGRFQYLIQEIVLGKLIVLTGQDPLSGKAVLNGPRHIDLAPDYSNILFAVHILPVQALLQLSADALRQNRSEEVMHVLELFGSNILIAALIQRREGIRKHIVYVFYEDALILAAGEGKGI